MSFAQRIFAIVCWSVGSVLPGTVLTTEPCFYLYSGLGDLIVHVSTGMFLIPINRNEFRQNALYIFISVRLSF